MPDIDFPAAVRARRPLVHCISNIVTANDCANILYAVGASPMMAEAPEEMAEITALADAADLNLGTPSRDKYAAARICLTESNRLGKPVVLDPVGVGASSWRLEQVALLLESGRPDIVRVNLAEAEALLGRGRSEQGVDSPGRTEREVRARAASALAARLGCAVLLTGPVDAAAAPDGRLELIEGGSNLAPLVTGSGCMLSALTGAFCGALPREPFRAACAAVAAMGVCGELAEERRLKNGTGNATFRNDLIDGVELLTPDILEQEARYDTL